MYHGNNPKALTSQKLLLDTLNELLKEKEFKDISVSELCSRSGVSRQTFYSLFETKENILLYQLEMLNTDKPAPDDHSAIYLDDVCEGYAHYVSSNYKQLSMLVENNLAEVLYEMIYNGTSSCRQSFVDMDEEDREYAILFISAGLCWMTQKYIANHNKPDKKELKRISFMLLSGSIYRRR